jgi:hypothetical protein
MGKETNTIRPEREADMCSRVCRISVSAYQQVLLRIPCLKKARLLSDDLGKMNVSQVIFERKYRWQQDNGKSDQQKTHGLV